jgi:hypothetical protein
MQALMLQEQVFYSNAYKLALIAENEKSESSHMNEASEHKELHQRAQTRDQIHFTLSLGPKLNLAPRSSLFNPFVFFSCPFLGFIPYLAKLGVIVPSFNDFMDNSDMV